MLIPNLKDPKEDQKISAEQFNMFFQQSENPAEEYKN